MGVLAAGAGKVRNPARHPVNMAEARPARHGGRVRQPPTGPSDRVLAEQAGEAPGHLRRHLALDVVGGGEGEEPCHEGAAVRGLGRPHDPLHEGDRRAVHRQLGDAEAEQDERVHRLARHLAAHRDRDARRSAPRSQMISIIRSTARCSGSYR